MSGFGERIVAAGRRVRRGLRRSSRTAKVLLATLTAAGAVGLVTVGPAAPAFADENGSEWCFLSTGSLGAPSPVSYGQFITVSWTVNPACPDLAIWINGPGFGGGNELLNPGGSRQVRAVTGGSTITWTLIGYPMDSSTPSPITLATRTITVL